jgi:hypothetical protein
VRRGPTENAACNTSSIYAWRHSVRDAILCCVCTGHYLATAVSLPPQSLFEQIRRSINIHLLSIFAAYIRNTQWTNINRVILVYLLRICCVDGSIIMLYTSVFITIFKLRWPVHCCEKSTWSKRFFTAAQGATRWYESLIKLNVKVLRHHPIVVIFPFMETIPIVPISMTEQRKA